MTAAFPALPSTHIADPQTAQVHADQALRQYYQSVGPAVLIPGLQAAITGLLAGSAIGSLAWLADYANPWRMWLFGTFSSQALAWVYILHRWLDIVRTMENWIPTTPEPPLPANVTSHTTNVETLRLAVAQDNRTQILNINIDPSRIYQAAALLAHGAQFAERDLAGGGKPFSQREFRLFRDELLRRGLLEWRNPDAPQQGALLTSPGVQLIQQLAVLAATTPLPHPA